MSRSSAELRAASRFLAAALTGLATLAPTAAYAQAYQCRAPAIASVPTIAPEAKPRRVPITGYTLALSWSPEFCKPRETSPRHTVQCSGSNGRFGMVVHGLWPQGARTWPQWCPARRPLTPQIVRRNMCVIPSARLVARQWTKHGACMTRKPETYFGITRVLWESLRIPEYDRISREDGLTAGRIRNTPSASVSPNRAIDMTLPCKGRMPP